MKVEEAGGVEGTGSFFRGYPDLLRKPIGFAITDEITSQEGNAGSNRPQRSLETVAGFRREPFEPKGGKRGHLLLAEPPDEAFCCPIQSYLFAASASDRRASK